MQTCGGCQETHPSAVGFLLRNDSVFATYRASWNPHGRESWVDMAIGSFEDPDYANQVLFACRIGPVDGQDTNACSLVTPQWGQPDPGPILGRSLDRDAALAHHWLPDFWQAIDWLILNDPFFHQPSS